MKNVFYLARSFQSPKIPRLSAALFLAATFTALSGCGGGGGGSGGADPAGAAPTGTAATTPAASGTSATPGGTTTGTAGTTPAATGTAATTGGTTTGAAGTTPAATGTAATTGGTTIVTAGTAPAATDPSAAGATTGTAGATSAATDTSATTGGTTTGAGQSLSVRLSSDLTLVSLPPNNAKLYNATVTDSGGHPVAGIEVRFVLRPGHYYTGRYSAAAAPGSLATQTTTAQCANEDTDFSGIYTAAKDLNQNGVLDPGGISSTAPSATTDANGIAAVRITYPKSHATWVEVMVEARIGSGVNDPPALAAFVLPGLITDYEFGGPASLDSISPYGATGAPPACIIVP